MSYDEPQQPGLQLDIGAVMRVLKRRIWFLLIPAIVLGGVAVAVAKMLPATYSSSGTIVIERPNIPPDLVDTTVTTYAAERIEIIRQRFIATDNLARLIEKHDLYPEKRGRMPMSAVAGGMRGDISVRTVKGSDGPSVAFRVGFTYPDPDKAKAIAEELVSWYLSENARTRQEMAQETASFLNRETEALEEEVARLERELSQFKERHGGSLPGQRDLNRSELERLQRSLRDTKFRLQALADERQSLQARIEALPEPDQGQGGSLEAARVANDLRALRDQRATLAVDYTDLHPDIKRLDRQIGQLESRLAQLPPPPSSGPEGLSPRQVQARQTEIERNIEAIDRQVAQVERRRKALEADIEEVRADLERTAQIADEYQSLQRRYQNAVADYSTMRRKQLSADMGATLELNQKSERFKLVNPPSRPTSPDSPNRMMIAGGGVVFAMGVGFALMLAVEMLDTRLRSARKAEQITGMEPLVLVPDIRTSGDAARSWSKRLALAAGVAAVLGAGLWYVHTNVEPLDILLIEAQRTLNDTIASTGLL